MTRAAQRSRSTRGSALARTASLLRDDAPAGPSERGYIDLLGPAPPSSTGPVQDLMLSRPLARIYERWWRPALGRAVKGVLGPGMEGERRIARRLLELETGDSVLDVACGTGSFTRDLGEAVGERGLSVGIDVSESMLARAVAATRPEAHPQVAYVRGDAQELPFRDATFDGVCCFAALNLLADPFLALDRITAVLRPGGRIALFTSARGRSTPLRGVEAVVAAGSGMRLFDRTELTGALEERGYERISQRLTGFTQFVGGRLRGG